MSAELVVKKLKKKKATLAVAESLTGGGLGSAITDISGSSAVFFGGVIAYSDEIKIKELGVSKATLKKSSAVSEAVAIEMAEGIRKKFKSTYGISTTGVAGHLERQGVGDNEHTVSRRGPEPQIGRAHV